MQCRTGAPGASAAGDSSGIWRRRVTLLRPHHDANAVARLSHGLGRLTTLAMDRNKSRSVAFDPQHLGSDEHLLRRATGSESLPCPMQNIGGSKQRCCAASPAPPTAGIDASRSDNCHRDFVIDIARRQRAASRIRTSPAVIDGEARCMSNGAGAFISDGAIQADTSPAVKIKRRVVRGRLTVRPYTQTLSRASVMTHPRT